MTELSNNNKENIILVKKLAKEAYPKNKIMEDLTVCQAILESGLRGKAPSGLALKYNNLFGIKWPSLAKNIKFLKDRGKVSGNRRDKKRIRSIHIFWYNNRRRYYRRRHISNYINFGDPIYSNSSSIRKRRSFIK